jgi:hypothetical protein
VRWVGRECGGGHRGAVRGQSCRIGPSMQRMVGAADSPTSLMPSIAPITSMIPATFEASPMSG